MVRFFPRVFTKKINLFLKGNYVSKSSKRSIANNLNCIFSFPQFKERLLYLPQKFFFKPCKKFYDYCEKDTQKAAEEICRYCGLNSISVKVTHEYLHIPKELTTAIGFGTGVGFDPGLPGQIYSLTKYQFSIFINNFYNAKTKAATLAHEITHAFIRYNEIKFETNSNEKEQFKEQMTDLTTIALGLGRLMLDGNSYCYLRDNIEYYGILGYLKPNIMEYAQALMELQIEEINRRIGAASNTT